MSQTFVWLFLMQRSFAAAADLKPKSALFGQIQCPAATKVDKKWTFLPNFVYSRTQIRLAHLPK